ncbi:MAG: endonuclease/exonuclease/phosphatase family protein [Gaiellales bacterium]
MRRTAFAIVCVTIGLGAVACGNDGKPETMRLRVMEFNIEYGGTLVSFDKVVEAIKVAEPDVVGLEEAETNAPRLAKAVGFPYASGGMHIISKYPILEPSGSGGAYAFIEVRPGEVVALSNVHLPSDPYGPYLVRDGKPLARILEVERSLRLSALEAQRKLLPPVVESGIPVFMTGDFNAPSHLDWTAAAAGSRKYQDRAIRWPVSAAVEKLGFRDSYREAHPDPVADPGLTWWAARPKAPDRAGNASEKDPQDRIDFVYAAGAAKTLTSDVIGEVGAIGVAKSVTPWPSDHRAVVSTFEVTPARMPVMIATDKVLFTAGETLDFTYKAGGENATLIITPQGDRTTFEREEKLEQRSGTVMLPGTLEPGAYDAVLSSSKQTVTTSFWVQAKGARTEVLTDKRAYRVGEPIEVSWLNAPANRWDWLGVYRAPTDTENDSYLVWQYTGGKTAGTLHGKPADTYTIDGDSTYGNPWPLPPGRYEVHYLLSDAYTSAGHASFAVR